MKDIKNYETFVRIEPVNKGLSDDKKYYIETVNGEKLLLRVAGIDEYERKKAEYIMLEKVALLDVIISRPVDFGICNDGKNVYSLLEWIDGKDVAEILPGLSEAEQYELGVKSGELLRKLHSIPAPNDTENWGIRFKRKVQNWLNGYNARPEAHSETGEMIIRYLEENSHVLEKCSQTFIHGDYNIENMIFTPDGEIGAIDFNSFNSSYGDPWWDLNTMVWIEPFYPSFYTGQIRGLFNGEPPTEFWNVFSYYLAYDALAAITEPYEANGIQDIMGLLQNILSWTDHFRNPVPSWYF